MQNAAPEPQTLSPLLTQTVSYTGTRFVESGGRWEGALTWGWATRILRQSVEGTAVMKVSVGTAHRPQRVPAPSPAGRHRCPQGHPSGKNLRFHTWDAAGMQPGRGSSFVSGAHGGSSLSCRQGIQVCTDIRAGFHSALAMLIPPAPV